MTAQLSLTLVDPFDLHVAPVLASEAFADLCRSLTRDRDFVGAVAARADQLRATWDPSVSPAAWCHALARQVAAERARARRDFEQQVVPMLHTLRGAAMRLTRDPTEADDLVQDTMLRARRFWATFQQGTDLKAWLFKVLRNTFINGYHRRGRKAAFEADVAVQMRSLGSTAALANSTSQPPGPEESVVASEERSLALQALASLPADYRMAVTLCDIDGLSYKEIAREMGCPIGTVMSRIYRGRKQIARFIQQDGRLADMAKPCRKPGVADHG